MNKESCFAYRSLEELMQDIRASSINLPVAEDLEIFNKPLEVKNNLIIPNRLAIHPMEGCDARRDGSPGELTIRRYRRFAAGGAGLIWVEAVAVNKVGRTNRQQLYLHQDNLDSFSRLVEVIRKTAQQEYGSGFSPVLVIQLHHAGRFGENKKIIFHESQLDLSSGIASDYPVMTDQEIRELEDDYLKSAELAARAGFDLVDIKSCNRYLLSEMLAAYQRQGEYGGSYQNRSRFLKNVINKIKSNVEIGLSVRLNTYDGVPYPYGWGADQEGQIDLKEPKRLVQEFLDLGVRLFNLSVGSPHIQPHLSRPYDLPGKDGYAAPEYPLRGVERLVNLAREIQETVQEGIVIGTGYSWLRELAPNVGAGVLQNEWAKMIGFGRLAIANPDFPRYIIQEGKLDSRNVCRACSKCVELKANQKNTGCVINDEVYRSIYQGLG